VHDEPGRRGGGGRAAVPGARQQRRRGQQRAQDMARLEPSKGPRTHLSLFVASNSHLFIIFFLFFGSWCVPPIGHER